MTDTLNPAQLAAVHHLAGPCLVLAGAGSGKTRVITHKIARLLQAGLEPKQIAAITFTNKASQEMRERAKGLVGARAAKDLVVSTFHSLGVRMLRTDGTRLNLKEQFSILDPDDVLGVLRDAGGTTDNKTARHWQWTISLWKNQGLDSAGAAQAVRNDDERVAAQVMKRYEERLAAYQAVDFDDLIGLPLKLLQNDAEARAKWQDHFRHVLIDEYQDTNAVQYELLKALVGEQGRFTAVGDDDQSIYGWRGATIENLKRLPQDFPALKVIPLEQNYRSTGAILRAANHVIAANPKLFEKKLWSEYGDGDPVRLLECDGEEHEAERAVAWIQSKRAEGGQMKFKDFAILYRANHQARVFEQKLRAAQVPYKVSGGQIDYSHTDLSDILQFLSLPQRFVPLRLSSIATITSGGQQFGGQGGGQQGGRGGAQGGRGQGGRGGGRGFRFITLDQWKPLAVNEVPFTLVDPQQGAVKNVLLFGSDASRFSRDLPKTVRLPCGMQAKALHLLSGVSIGGYPTHAEATTSLTVRLNYEGGRTEDHELKNSVHFARYERREDVPESRFAFAMGEQQMRHVTITPERTDTIVDIEFIKGDDPTVPIVLAVTAELQ